MRSELTLGGMMRLIIDVPALRYAAGQFSWNTGTSQSRNAPSSCIETFDKFLHLPQLDVLLCDVLAHFGG
jgi:hypothetical protein